MKLVFQASDPAVDMSRIRVRIIDRGDRPNEVVCEPGVESWLVGLGDSAAEAAEGAYATIPIVDEAADASEAPAETTAHRYALVVELGERHQWTWQERAALRTAGALLARDLRMRAEIGLTKSQLARREADRLHDPATGLPNRDVFIERLEQAVRRAARHEEYDFAVLLLDIDQLDAIHHGLGRSVGEALVRSLAERLKPLVRTDDLLARSPSEGFLILLEHVHDAVGAGRVAMRIQDALSTPLSTADTELRVSATIGIMLSSGGLDSPERLLELAAVARARAQELRMGDFQIFEPEMQRRVQRRLDQETELRRALERQEFEMYYQPLVCLETGEIAEVEALVRWNHPTRGLVRAADFIPIAEETELILPLGWWVVANACPQINEWHQRFPNETPLALTVNMSARHLALDGFLDRMESILAVSGLAPAALRVEITESVLIGDPAAVHGKLAALRAMGASIYLDDFGAGYSSLRYLRDLPLDGIKLDRSFLQHVKRGRDDAPIVRTVRQLARDIGVRAIAEGIETEEQLELVRSLEYDLAQGYYLGVPLPWKDVEALLARGPHSSGNLEPRRASAS